VVVRTSISIDDRLAEQVRRRAREEGVSVSAWIARVLDDRLKRRVEEPAPPFRLITVGGGGPRPGIDLDRPREILVAEDETRYGRRTED
jgi:Ribbon-helix-helix protein, copG family